MKKLYQFIMRDNECGGYFQTGGFFENAAAAQEAFPNAHVCMRLEDSCNIPKEEPVKKTVWVCETSSSFSPTSWKILAIKRVELTEGEFD